MSTALRILVATEWAVVGLIVAIAALQARLWFLMMRRHIEDAPPESPVFFAFPPPF